MEAKKNATAWQIRCTRCDFTEPWDNKGSDRQKNAARKFFFGRCPQCKRIRFRVIEKVPDAKLGGL
jgi:Zn finger protein HypA/HybF involved in hydrogenase expression